jgi:fumarate reductase flavoprotein subunit
VAIGEPFEGGADAAGEARDEGRIGLVLGLRHDVGGEQGLPFSVITDFRYPGHSANRMHGLPSRSGEELVDRGRTRPRPRMAPSSA